MTTTVEDLVADVLDLPAEDRARLLELLISSFEPKSECPESLGKAVFATSRRSQAWGGGDGSWCDRYSACKGKSRVSYWLHPDAEAELGEAAVFYAERASQMVALAFLDEFERVVALLVENQQRGPHDEDGLRVYHFNRFPHTLIYAVDATKGPQIYAVAHQSREPGYWQGRTQKD